VSIAHAATDDDALESLADRLLELDGRVLMLGAPGTGKSTLALRLGGALARRGTTPGCIGADPGSPQFGAPGAVCLGRWDGGEWKLVALEALCSLDAGRFRLPLTACVRRLAPGDAAPLILDGVLVIERPQRGRPLAAELRALDLPVLGLHAARAARRPGKPARARARTRLWDAYLSGAGLHALDPDRHVVLGTPPPREAAPQWQCRQAALVEPDGHTVALGEVHRWEDGRLMLRSHAAPAPGQALLVRDARRGADGMLGTAGPDVVAAVRYVAPADVLPGAPSASGPRPVVRAGPATIALVNGVLGDPLLHVRLHHRRRSLLFDLGEAGRLSAKVAHQVSDVFLSHAHLDHIAGFLWMVRSRIGALPALRVFGPPGIAENVRGLLAGVHWDRVEDRGPRFEVAEFDGMRLACTRLQAGGASAHGGTTLVNDGLLLDEPELRVRAAVLDHGTPVLAFALETQRTLKVRKERLSASGLEPGPWLTRLKTLVAGGNLDAVVTLPDSRTASAETLAEALLMDAPGIKIAYATDLADTDLNRARLAELARGAHTLFCEASFVNADQAQARRTGHLTTRACGEIAALAGVERLVPFHFSRRYEGSLESAYDEIRAAFSRTITPPLAAPAD
jgi:ribonuclease BN (tRNA processing enzyme)